MCASLTYRSYREAHAAALELQYRWYHVEIVTYADRPSIDVIYCCSRNAKLSALNAKYGVKCQHNKPVNIVAY